MNQLLDLLMETKRRHRAIDQNIARLASTLPNPATLGTLNEHTSRQLFAVMIEAMESMEDAAEGYLRACQRVTAFVRAELDDSMPPSPWNPPADEEGQP